MELKTLKASHSTRPSSLFDRGPRALEHGRPRRDAAFTLIEIMIVIGLIGLVMTLALPGIGLALKENLNNASRELATLIRAAHDESVLKGAVYRVVFDIDKGQYWVEVGDRDYLLRTSEQEEEERKRNERRNDVEKAAHKDSFQLATLVTKKKQSLPLGVNFTDLVTPRSKDPIKAGTVYAHMFPFGFVEKTVIHLKDDMGRETTLSVSPVTGKSRLYNRYVKEVD
jgi:prepilin-type N-terminal cleavage/methylation domain-containing protein